MRLVPPLVLSVAPPRGELERFARESAGAMTTRHPTGCIERGQLPAGWRVNRHEAVIGAGAREYERAADALRELRMMQLPWLRAVQTNDAILAICSRQLGCCWLLNANRLLRSATNERSRSGRRTSVHWATTRSHVLAGEEEVAVRWDRATDDVTFSVLSFSRPRHALSVLTYPYVLLQQRRFARDATDAMRRFARASEVTSQQCC